ncbi:MAG: hypothetical protein JHD23_10625 [Akkermansiaceae bacterium]|nr:hypothetical protein [Akkermansiaceae bacterium]
MRCCNAVLRCPLPWFQTRWARLQWRLIYGAVGDFALVADFDHDGAQQRKAPARKILHSGRKFNSRPRKCLDYAKPNDIFTAPPPITLVA